MFRSVTRPSCDTPVSVLEDKLLRRAGLSTLHNHLQQHLGKSSGFTFVSVITKMRHLGVGFPTQSSVTYLFSSACLPISPGEVVDAGEVDCLHCDEGCQQCKQSEQITFPSVHFVSSCSVRLHRQRNGSVTPSGLGGYPPPLP